MLNTGGNVVLMSEENKELITITKDDAFQKKVTAKVLDTSEDMFLFKCSDCGNIHFRHAGYIESLIPFIKADREKSVCRDSLCVMICTKCKNCFVWYNEQMHDVTKLIDLEAWEKTERELHEALGPGGINC